MNTILVFLFVLVDVQCSKLILVLAEWSEEQRAQAAELDQLEMEQVETLMRAYDSNLSVKRDQILRAMRDTLTCSGREAKGQNECHVATLIVIFLFFK